MSGMSDVEVQGQIAHMIAFIDQEASEKVEEIDAKAEEEFNLEKGRLVQQGRVKVMEYYDKKEKGIEQNMKIQHSNLLNASRLAILKKKQELLEEFEEQSREETIKDLEGNPAKYREIMISMTVQGLVRMMENRVLVQVRPQDVKLMESIIQECQDQYAAFMNKEIQRRKQDFSVTITLSEDRLPSDLVGGVILLTEDEKISCNNTMDARLKDIFKQNQPQIRETLFGANPNRRFKD